MAARQPKRPLSLLVRGDRPLIGVIRQEDGQALTEYFVEEKAVEEAASRQGIQEALDLAGAWSDLDWEEAKAEFNRIRHDSRPTPPVTDL